MGGMSAMHWVIVLAIVVLLFGAKKIPELAKGLGKGIKTFKKEMEDDTPVEKIEENQDKKSQENQQNESVKNSQ